MYASGEASGDSSHFFKESQRILYLQGVCVVNISSRKLDKMALIVISSDVEKGGNSFDSPRMDEGSTVESK